MASSSGRPAGRSKKSVTPSEPTGNVLTSRNPSTAAVLTSASIAARPVGRAGHSTTLYRLLFEHDLFLPSRIALTLEAPPGRSPGSQIFSGRAVPPTGVEYGDALTVGVPRAWLLGGGVLKALRARPPFHLPGGWGPWPNGPTSSGEEQVPPTRPRHPDYGVTGQNGS